MAKSKNSPDGMEEENKVFLRPFKVGRSEKYGLFDIKGNFLVEPIFDSASGYPKYFSEGLAAVGIGKFTGGKYGYINTKGEWVIEPQFYSADPFSEGLAEVNIDGKNGSINTKGEMVIEPKFCSDINTKFKNGIAVVKIYDPYIMMGNYGYGIINTKGEWIFGPLSGNGTLFQDGIAEIEIGGKTGYINTKGEWVIEPYTKKKAKRKKAVKSTSNRMKKIVIELFGDGCQIDTYDMEGELDFGWLAMIDGEYSEIIVIDGDEETAYSVDDCGENIYEWPDDIYDWETEKFIDPTYAQFEGKEPADVFKLDDKWLNFNSTLYKPKGKLSRIVNLSLKGHAFINIEIPENDDFEPKKLHFIDDEFTFPDCNLDVNTRVVYDGKQYKIEVDPDSDYGCGCETIWEADEVKD